MTNDPYTNNNDHLPPYSPVAIANYFITHSKDNLLDLMKIQKMIYVAHGMMLALCNRRLINEAIEAWQYGPVIRSVYETFKQYRLDVIKSPAENREGEIPKIKEDDMEAKATLDSVIRMCNGITGIQLSNWSHEEGAPWDQIYNKTPDGRSGYAEIPNEMIKTYFDAQYKQVPK